MSKIRKSRRPRRPLLVGDSFRALVGSVVLLGSIVGGVVVGQADTSSASMIFQLTTLGWSGFAITTIVLIWLANASS